MPRSNAIAAENATGGSRPGAGAASVPNSGPPQKHKGNVSPGERFRRAKILATRRRGRRQKAQARTRRSSDTCGRATPAFAVHAKRLISHLSQTSRGGAKADKHSDPVVVERPQQATTNAGDGVQPGRVTEPNTAVVANLSGSVDASPDDSGQFQTECGALLAYFAALIDAARRRLPASIVIAVVQMLMNEQTAAMRALTERKQATTRSQRGVMPERPPPTTHAKGESPKSG